MRFLQIVGLLAVLVAGGVGYYFYNARAYEAAIGPAVSANQSMFGVLNPPLGESRFLKLKEADFSDSGKIAAALADDSTAMMKYAGRCRSSSEAVAAALVAADSGRATEYWKLNQSALTKLADAAEQYSQEFLRLSGQTHSGRQEARDATQPIIDQLRKATAEAAQLIEEAKRMREATPNASFAKDFR